MPIYEYRCPQGHTFEEFRRMTDDLPEACEVCGQGPVETVLFPVAVHFKGSGFYSTDYGRGRKSPPSKDGGEGGGGEGGGETKKDDAPKKKEEPKKKAAEA